MAERVSTDGLAHLDRYRSSVLFTLLFGDCDVSVFVFSGPSPVTFQATSGTLTNVASQSIWVHLHDCLAKGSRNSASNPSSVG
jgi:hypothetical protein